QFAVQGQDIYILEVNPRASRTVPFVAKATGIAIAKIAARVMAGASLDAFQEDLRRLPNWTAENFDRIAIKEAVFPFNRFPGVDIMLGPEMRSTGEVMGLAHDFDTAFAKAQLAANVTLPKAGNVFVSVKDSDKAEMARVAKHFLAMGFAIIATDGTQKFLENQSVACVRVNKVMEGNNLGQPHIVDRILNDEIALVCNTTEGQQAIIDSRPIRQATLRKSVPYYTTMAGISAAVWAIDVLRKHSLKVAALQDYC
ncbi:MAG: carbamoyl phosphate synthase large subunit, partial [Pseudomonadota bacterium]